MGETKKMCAPISVSAVTVGGAVAAQAVAMSQIIGAAVLGSIFALNFFHPLRRRNIEKVEE